MGIQQSIIGSLNTLGTVAAIGKGLEEQKKQTEQAAIQTAAQEKANKIAEQAEQTAEAKYKTYVIHKYADEWNKQGSLTKEEQKDLEKVRENIISSPDTKITKADFDKLAEIWDERQKRIESWRKNPAVKIKEAYIKGEIKNRADYENKLASTVLEQTKAKLAISLEKYIEIARKRKEDK